ncbi:Inversin-B [Paramyrothecium foliicola]|nr:Inversin-B [Paramyrothecium foliicola]
MSLKWKVYLLIDGIDEVESYSTLTKHIISLIDSSSRVNILATSRRNPHIQEAFCNVRDISLEHHKGNIDADIRQYITNRLASDQQLAWLPVETRQFVAKTLLSKSSGNFRWAACQLDALRHCRTTRDVKETLKQLPLGLNETYGQLLARSAARDIPLLRSLLTWLCFSYVPITLRHLWEALAIETGRSDIDNEYRLRNPEQILLLGQNLITTSPDGHVMLAHLSVKEFLLSPGIKNNPKTAKFALNPKQAHENLSLDCLTYLFFSEFSSGPALTEEAYLTRLERFPLLNYASRYWFNHVHGSEPSTELQDLTNRFFTSTNRNNFMSWVQILNADSPFKWNVYPRHATSLYYASSLGLELVVESLLRTMTQEEVNSPGSRFGGTAFHAATIREHLGVIQQLIAAGADPSKADFNKVTPLHSAASQGNVKVIRLLLDHGASIHPLDGMDGKTPEQWATLSGHEDAAKTINEYSTVPEPLRGQWDADTRGQTDCGLAEPWRPKKGYFPDHYETRSGLNCSHIMGIIVGDNTLSLDTNFVLGNKAGHKDSTTAPVW